MTSKLIYIFVAGVEGVGHHGLHPVIETAFLNSKLIKENNGEVISYKKRMKRGFNQIWCHEHIPPFTFFKKLFRWYLNSFFSNEKRKARDNNQVRVIIEDNSFPAGSYRNLEKQWKLDEMHDIVSPHADEIYYIGLYRDPIAAIFSHKEFDNGLMPHAHKIRASLEYLNKELEKVDPQRLRIVHYEDLIGNQEAVGAVLADYFGLAQEDLAAGFAKVRPSKKDWRRDMADEDKKKMTAIFNQQEGERYWPKFLNPSRIEG